MPEEACSSLPGTFIFFCSGPGALVPFWSFLSFWYIRHLRCKAKAIFKIMPDRYIFWSGMFLFDAERRRKEHTAHCTEKFCAKKRVVCNMFMPVCKKLYFLWQFERLFGNNRYFCKPK